eukprot:gene6929-9560_t
MTSQFIETCKILFNQADVDGNGTLDPDEFKAVLESDSLKLNLQADEIAQIIESSDKDGEGVTLSEFVPIVQALFFRHRAQKASEMRKPLPSLKRHQTCSALERQLRRHAIPDGKSKSASEATTRSESSTSAKHQTLAQRRWGIVRGYIDKGAAERSLAMPVQIDRLDLATITKLVAGARTASETDVWNLRRQASDAVKDGAPEKAEMLYTFAVKLAESLFQKQGQVLLSLTALADVQIQMEKYPEAISTLQRCLKMRRSAIITDKAAILACLVELCLCSLAICRFEDGVSYGVQAYEHHKATNARILSSVARWKEFLMRLAKASLELLNKRAALTAQGKYSLAMEVQEQAVSVLMKQMEKSSREASHVLTSLGFVTKVAQGSELERIEDEFTRRTVATSSPNHGGDGAIATSESTELTHANTMYSLGRHLLQQKQAADATPLIQNSLSVFTRIYGRKHPRVGFAMTALASCFALEGSQRMLRRAINLLERAAGVLTACLGPDCKPLADAGGPLPVRAQIEEMLGQFQAARRTWAHVAHIRLIRSGETDEQHLDAVSQKKRLTELISRKKPIQTLESQLRQHEEKLDMHSNLCIVCGLKTTTRTCQACANAQELYKLSCHRYIQNGAKYPRLWMRYLSKFDELAPSDSTTLTYSQPQAAPGSLLESKRTSRAATRSYRTVSRTSNADELLFGSAPPTRRMPQTHQSSLQGFYSGEGTTQLGAGGRVSTRGHSAQPEVCKIVTKDGVRTLRVPRREQESATLILTRNEFERIKQNARICTKEDLERERRQRQEERERQAQACEERKARMARLEAQRTQREPMSDLDIQAKERNEHLLAQARLQMEEEEDEIKHLNEMILQAKIYAIRDAQLAEKQAIEKEITDEQHRLDEMMEIERLRSIKEQEEQELAVRKMRERGAEQIRQQLSEREQQKMIEEELKDQETQALLKQMKRMQEEDLEEARRKREENQKKIEEIARVNEEAKIIQEERLRAEHEEELRMAEYLKEREQREAELEREREEEKRRRDREFAALLAKQEQAMDKVAEKQALEARRQQEAVERARRKKEKEEAEAKQKTMEEIQRTREQQIKAKERFMLMQAQQDRAEFERIVQNQEHELTCEKKKEFEEKRKKCEYAEMVRKQIEEQENQRRKEREEFFTEGKMLHEEAEARRRRLNEIKQRKLQELKSLGIEPKYIAPVERAVATGDKHKVTAPVPLVPPSNLLVWESVVKVVTLQESHSKLFQDLQSCRVPNKGFH